MCKKLIKNYQPFGKKFQKTIGGFFDSHCRVIKYHLVVVTRSVGEKCSSSSNDRVMVPSLMMTGQTDC